MKIVPSRALRKEKRHNAENMHQSDQEGLNGDGSSTFIFSLSLEFVRDGETVAASASAGVGDKVAVELETIVEIGGRV